MPTIQPSSIPPSALLSAYSGDVGYADCYFTEVSSLTSLATFVEAFYTTPLFKVERTILRWFAAKPASDADARALAKGANTFSAWKVENRTPDELLLADFTGRTRSWLMAVPLRQPDGTTGTRLYFGSAVVPRRSSDGARDGMGFGFHVLLGFHKLYSRLLLRSARAGLPSAA